MVHTLAAGEAAYAAQPWRCRGQAGSSRAAIGSHHSELKRDKAGLHCLLLPRSSLTTQGCRHRQPAKKHWPHMVL